MTKPVPARRYRRHSLQFKMLAVARLELGESPTALSRELGIGHAQIYRWRDQHREGQLTGPTEAPRPPPEPQAHAQAALQSLAEIIRQMNFSAGTPSQTPTDAPASQASDIRGASAPIRRIEWVIVRPEDRRA